MSAVVSTASTMRAVSARPRRSLNGRFASGVVAGNDAGATVIGHISPGPIHEHGEPVAESDQKPNMGEAPDQPRQKSGKVKAAEIRNRSLAADGSEITEVAIGERRRVAPRDRSTDRLSGVAAHLLGSRSHSRNRASPRVADRGRITDDEDVAVPGKAEIGSDDD